MQKENTVLALSAPMLFDNQNSKEWLTTNEAAKFLGVSPNALRIRVHRDQVPVYKFGRRLRFRLRDCQALFIRKGA
jgi:excisionase family DNA binding protein